MTIVFYNSKAERGQLIAAANQANESTIHDDFIDSNGNPTNGQSGRLTFGVLVSPPNPNFIRLEELRQKLRDNTLNSLPEIIEYTQLRDGL